MASKKSLQAAAATSGLFEHAQPQASENKPKRGRPKKVTEQQATAPVTAPTPETKRETATFSVKIDTEILKRWRYYASANGYGDKGKLTEAAITEYMNRHKLTPEQQAKVDLLCSVD